jgi:hypothetical protein
MASKAKLGHYLVIEWQFELNEESPWRVPRALLSLLERRAKRCAEDAG